VTLLLRARRLPALLLLLALTALLAPPAGAAATSAARPQLPVLAYYYQWFNASSWKHAKHDYPSVGRYTSDETTVMRTHIRAARSAGVTGFLVSWKDTALNDERLAKLVEVARGERFTLGIVYQGLDVRREPLPVSRVLTDMRSFAQRWGSDPVFAQLGRPLMIWAGTWRFSLADLALVANAVRPSLQLLASERDTDRWAQVGPLLDGNAYYWSSVDPAKDRRAATRLQEMGAAVHATHGLWIAPAAPGFDARLNGGTREVPRQGGATLRTEWADAVRSSPDAIGLISWNEFTESTYVEPSEAYGTQALQTLASLTGSKGPHGELDSSAPAGHGSGGPWRALVLASLLLVLAAAALLRSYRHRAPRTTRRAEAAASSP
jgi:hypothetical protein